MSDATSDYIVKATITETGSILLEYASGPQSNVLVFSSRVVDSRVKPSFFAGVAAWAAANPLKVSALVGLLAGAVPDSVVAALKILL